MAFTRCSLCDRPAVFLDRRSGKAYCADHFRGILEDRVRREVRREGLARDERIVMGISGGKDSLVMMDLLWRVEKDYGVELIALTVDEGIEGGQYRGRRVELVKKMAQERGIKYVFHGFKEKYGFTLDEAVEALRGKEEPCTICGILRRRALNDYAKELGATRLAIAHVLDDEAETVLMNVVRGDPKGLLTSENYSPELFGFYVPRIKPLREVTERESAFYAYLLGIPPEDEECPYARFSLRDGVRLFLEQLESKHPGTSSSVVRFGDKLRAGQSAPAGEIKRSFCSVCGYPTSEGRDLCRVCELRRAVEAGERKRAREAVSRTEPLKGGERGLRPRYPCTSLLHGCGQRPIRRTTNLVLRGGKEVSTFLS
ncbi:MAG: TIGR00269 family protein [Candidatus Marsarchaeota archaeon]